jgi:hypothetical protein
MTARIARWVLIVISVVAYQGLLAEYLSPGGAGLRWDLLIILLAGLTGGATRGALAGGIVGFMVDCLTPSFLGWGMMVNITLGAVVGMSRERLFLERVLARWLVLAMGILLHDIIYLLPVTGFDLALYAGILWYDTMFSVIITSVVGTGALAIWGTIRKTKTPPEPAVSRSNP